MDIVSLDEFLYRAFVDLSARHNDHVDICHTYHVIYVNIRGTVVDGKFITYPKLFIQFFTVLTLEVLYWLTDVGDITVADITGAGGNYG